jgi:hypothetical protein
MTTVFRKRLLSFGAIGLMALAMAAAPVQFGPSLDVDAWANGSHPGSSGPPGPGGGNPGSSGPGASGPGNGDQNGK